MSSVASKTVPLTCHGHSRPITHLSFSPILGNEHYYLISSYNNPMFRDGKTGDWIGTFLGHKGAVWQGRLSSDASYAATGSADFTAKLWDTNTGECLETFQHEHMVRAVALSPGATPERLGTGGPEKKLRIYDLRRGALHASDQASTTATGLATIPALELGAGVHDGAIKAVIWSPDANVVISAAEDKAVRWWDVRAPRPIATCMLDGPLGSFEITNLSSTNSLHSSILAVAAGKSAYFFSGSTPGQLIKSVSTPHEIAAVAIDRPENKFVTGGSADTWVRVYSFEEEEELSLLKGHHGPVWTASFAPDNKLFATGSEDGTIKLWKFTAQTYGLWK